MMEVINYLNILYLINYAGIGGSERYVKLLASAYTKKNDMIFFVYNKEDSANNSSASLVTFFKNIKATCMQLNMSHPLDIIAAYRLSNFCRLHKINIIHTQFPRENYIAILSKLFYNKPKVIYTAHVHIANNNIYKLLNYILTRFNKYIIAVCTSVATQLKQNKYKKSKIKIIFNGVQQLDATDYKKNDTFTFVTLSRLSEEKGMLFLLKSVLELKKIRDDFLLLIAGDGPLKSDLENYIAANNLASNVHLLGYITNTWDILTKSHVYINTSKSEACSIAILEALSFGLPIIATDVGGTPDIINTTTNCGMLIPYGDYKKLSEKMDYIMNNNTAADAMSQNSLDAIKNIFNIEKMINATYELYSTCD